MPDTLRKLLEGEPVVHTPGVWDGMTTRLAQDAGFPAVFASGLAIAASMGIPDADIYTKADVLTALRQICDVSRVPVLADGDTGYGTAVNVAYMVRDFERAGVTAVAIEDQLSPKRCPLLPGKAVPIVDLEEAAGKIRAAVAARTDPDFLIIARSDAGDPEEMHRRADAFAAAGADLFFPNAVDRAMFPPEEWASCHERTGLPLVACPIPGRWQEEELTPEVMEQIGVKVQWLSVYPLYAAMSALRSVMRSLRSEPRLADALDTDFGYPDLTEIVGYRDIEAIQAEYIPGAEAPTHAA